MNTVKKFALSAMLLTALQPAAAMPKEPIYMGSSDNQDVYIINITKVAGGYEVDSDTFFRKPEQLPVSDDKSIGGIKLMRIKGFFNCQGYNTPRKVAYWDEKKNMVYQTTYNLPLGKIDPDTPYDKINQYVCTGKKPA